MVGEVELFVTTSEMTRKLPELPEMTTLDHNGIFYWVDSGLPVDWDELVRLGYYEKRKECPACAGSGMLPKEK